jgi:hypothetical protein
MANYSAVKALGLQRSDGDRWVAFSSPMAAE